MKDYVIRATACDGLIRAFAARTTNLTGEAQRIHNLFPEAAAALGRVMTAAVMMAADMKGDSNTVSIIVKGSGPLGSILAVASPIGSVKGYVSNPYVDIPLNQFGKLDVGSAVGPKGKLTVIKDLGLKEPYIGQVELVSGEIGDDITNYFWVSEQQPSAVALGTLVNPDMSVKASGGFIIQLMPGADNLVIEKVENKLAEIQSVSSMIDQGFSPEDILNAVLGDMELKCNTKNELYFKCDCSKERLEKVIISLGEKEIRDIIEKDGKAELVCHYCNQKYQFNKNELKKLLDQAMQI